MINLVLFWCRCQLKRFRNEQGISTLDWIGLTAVVLTLLTAIILYWQTSGARQLGFMVAEGFLRQIRRWDMPVGF